MFAHHCCTELHIAQASRNRRSHNGRSNHRDTGRLAAMGYAIRCRLVASRGRGHRAVVHGVVHALRWLSPSARSLRRRGDKDSPRLSDGPGADREWRSSCVCYPGVSQRSSLLHPSPCTHQQIAVHIVPARCSKRLRGAQVSPTALVCP
eukprot:5357096-Prymnesium_polylepis.1